MKDFRELRVWEAAHKLTLDVYQVTRTFPKEEIYGLTHQIRRASVSIPTNIAEGCGKDSKAEFLRYLYISMGSASELDYQLQLAHELTYLSDEDYRIISNHLHLLRRMLNAFIQKIKGDQTEQKYISQSSQNGDPNA